MVFILILVIILIIVYYYRNNLDNFYILTKYPYNPPIQTLQSNYNDITNKINFQNQYKKDLSVALSPIPTIKCDELHNKENCNQYGCNWFGTFCSAMYPSYL